MTRTITRLFDNYSDAAEAVSELERIGIPRDDISLVANNAHGEHAAPPEGVNDHGDVTRGTTTGAVLGGGAGLLAGLGLLAIPGLGPIVAAGWLAATAVGAGVGAVGGAATGGIVGALKAAGHTDEEANVYAEGVRRGGTLLSAKVDDGTEPEVVRILEGLDTVDIAGRGAHYRANGWAGFDDRAPEYTSEEIARERAERGLSTRY